MIIAGIDASYRSQTAIGVGVVCKYPEGSIIEKKTVILSEKRLFPYIPGLLFLKEGPLIINILNKFETKPQVIFVNGHGKAHPTGFGLAVFVEKITATPTIGCAKEVLVGKYKDFNHLRGKYAYVVYKNKRIGIALCTKDNTKPLIISSGGKLKLKELYTICLSTTTTTRWPYPLYLADKESKTLLQNKVSHSLNYSIYRP